MRSRLYELLAQIPNGDPAVRMASLDAVLASLPAEEAAAVERRALALTEVYARTVQAGANPKLDDFFAAVDAEETKLSN